MGKCESIWIQESNRNVSGEERLRLGGWRIDIYLNRQANSTAMWQRKLCFLFLYVYKKTVFILIHSLIISKNIRPGFLIQTIKKRFSFSFLGAKCRESRERTIKNSLGISKNASMPVTFSTHLLCSCETLPTVDWIVPQWNVITGQGNTLLSVGREVDRRTMKWKMKCIPRPLNIF